MSTLTRDPLTQAYRRDGLPTFSAHFIAESARNGAPLSMLVFDLDHFKGLNDAFGHDYGDCALREVVARTRPSLRGEDLLFRWGGDEFVALLPGTDLADAVRIAERMIERVGSDPLDPPSGHHDGVRISLSVGVASYPQDALDAGELFRRADRRLLAAKRLGRARAIAYDAAGATTLDFDRAAARSLAREAALEVGHRFLATIRRSGRTLLSVDGARGAGRSHYLRELGRAARLHGAARLELRGADRLAQRELATLRVGRIDGVPLPLPADDLSSEQALRTLVAWLRHEGRTRLLITADGADAFDAATVELCRALLAEDELAVGLAYCGRHGSAAPLFGRPELRATLNGFSVASAGAWLGSVLGGPPPEGLAERLFERSGGLPGGMRRTLERLHQIGALTRRGEGWSFHPDPTEPPTPPAPPVRLHAPLPPSLLVGREAELAALVGASERHPLVTLVGPGGIGKTHLLLQFARERVAAYRDGVGYVALDSDALADPPHDGSNDDAADDVAAAGGARVASDRDALALAIARGCGLALSRGSAPWTALRDAVSGRELLIVLDHGSVRDRESAALTELTRLPGVRLVAAAREPLGVPGEFPLPLRGLALPEPPTPLGESDLEVAAARLFLVRCAESGFELPPTGRADPAVRSAVVRICRSVDGSPLMLELAARWASTLGLVELADRLTDGAPVLDDAAAVDPLAARIQRTLGSFWELLDEREQQSVAALARFRSGFDAAAARRVAGASRFFLQALLERGFVRSEEGHFRMQPLLREFAATALEDTEAVDARHLALHAERAAAATARSGDALTVDAYREVDAGWGDYHSAFARAIAACGRHEDEGAVHFRPLATLLRGYLDVRGRIPAGLQLFAAAADAFAGRTEADPLDRAWALESLALFAFHSGDLSRAERCAAAALELLTPHIPAAHAAAPRDPFTRAAPPTPPPASEAALHGYALALNTFGMVLCHGGDAAAGQRRFAHALALRRSLGDRIGASRMLGNLATATSMLGDLSHAVELRRASNRIHRELGNSSSLALGRVHLGLALLDAGHYDDADTELTAGGELAQRIGYPLVLGTAARGQARIALARDDLAAACRAAERSVRAYAIMHTADTPPARALWACCLAFAGERERAGDVCERLRVDALRTGQTRDADHALRALAALALAGGRRVEARRQVAALRSSGTGIFSEVDARLRRQLGDDTPSPGSATDGDLDLWELLRSARPQQLPA